MRRWAFLFVLVFGTAGCVDGDVGLTIDRFITPDDNCVFSPGNMTIFRGVWDTASPFGYTVAPVVQSQLVRLPTELGADPMELVVEGLIVELRGIDAETPLDLGALNNPYTVRAHTTIDSSINVDQAGEEGVVLAEMIPAEYGPALQGLLTGPGDVDTINVMLQAFGSTRGGTSVTSVETVWPFRICDGCFNNCAADPDLCLPGQEGNPYCVLP